MRAIDTNVLVRFLAKDRPEQSAKALAIIQGGDVFVATTVFLEAEWVLRSAYAFAVGEILKAFEAFAGLPGITLEDPELLAQAIDFAREGLDFADALHLARAGGCAEFVTFDQKLVKAAGKVATVRAVLA